MRMTIADIAAVLGLPMPANAGAGHTVVHGAAIDSRRVQAGQLFVCIRGERVDGHDFAAAAVQAGAVAVLAERPVNVPVPVLLVKDTVKALGVLASAWRERFRGVVVAVTGSAGKTTVKEVLAHVLSARGLVAKNALNLNNQLGMPLSVLATSGEELFWVMELGISQAHDMDELGAILRPDIALLLNAGAAHTEGLGERGVAYHKAALLRHLRSHGKALVCADYADLAREARSACPTASYFSATGRPVPYRAAYSGLSKKHAYGQSEGWGAYRLWLDGQAVDIAAPFCGAYGAENSIAIAAAAHLAGMKAREIAAAFAGALLPPQRCALRSVGAWRLMDDTYNANPLSMRRMVESAVELAAGAPVYAVLGAMGELGPLAPEEHHTLGRLLALHKVRAVFWCGAYADEVYAGLQAEQYTGRWHSAASPEDFLRAWEAAQPEPGLILCKGSRSNYLENWVAVLMPLLALTKTEASNVL